MLEPAQRLELGDLLEALVAVGELDEAEAVLDLWEPRAAAVDRAWALAILARCRGLVRAARGDLDGALSAFEAAFAAHDRSCDPFHHARTALALGRTQRRAKKRAAARATLEDARSRFEALGAPLWAAQARDELARIGGRAPSRDDLTEAERRVATLVAEGRYEPAGRGRAVPDRALGRDGPHARLPEARRALPDGARTTAHGDGLRGRRSPLR